MHIVIKSLENKELELHVECREFNYGGDGPRFWVRYVMGDDWLGQSFHCDVQAAPVEIRSGRSDVAITSSSGGQHHLVITYQAEGDARAFAEWAERANAVVENGFRTMRG